MIVTIPIPQGKPAIAIRVELDGTDYVLDLTWNERSGAWYLGVLAADGVTPLAQGVKVVTNRFLLDRFHYVDGMPAGDLVAADPAGSVSYPGYGDLGNQIGLHYFDAEEMAAL